jgi:hypothetical protein
MPPNRTSTSEPIGMGPTEVTRRPMAEISSTLTAAMSPVLQSTENSLIGYLGSARRSREHRSSTRDMFKVLRRLRCGAMVNSYSSHMTLVYKSKATRLRWAIYCTPKMAYAARRVGLTPSLVSSKLTRVS